MMVYAVAADSSGGMNSDDDSSIDEDHDDDHRHCNDQGQEATLQFTSKPN